MSCKFCDLYNTELTYARKIRNICRTDFYVRLFRFDHSTGITQQERKKFYFKFCPMCGEKLNNYKK